MSESIHIREESIAKLASIVHEANKAYCAAMNDPSQKDWDDASDGIQQSAIDGVKAIIANPNMTAADIHDNWMKFKAKNGWTYGTTKDEAQKTHPQMVEYDQLSPYEQFKDRLFIDIVKSYLNFRNGE